MKPYQLFYIFLKLLSVSSADSEDSAVADPNSKVFYNTDSIFNITGNIIEIQFIFIILIFSRRRFQSELVLNINIF